MVNLANIDFQKTTLTGILSVLAGVLIMRIYSTPMALIEVGAYIGFIACVVGMILLVMVVEHRLKKVVSEIEPIKREVIGLHNTIVDLHKNNGVKCHEIEGDSSLQPKEGTGDSQGKDGRDKEVFGDW